MKCITLQRYTYESGHGQYQLICCFTHIGCCCFIHLGEVTPHRIFSRKILSVRSKECYAYTSISACDTPTPQLLLAIRPRLNFCSRYAHASIFARGGDDSSPPHSSWTHPLVDFSRIFLSVRTGQGSMTHHILNSDIDTLEYNQIKSNHKGQLLL